MLHAGAGPDEGAAAAENVAIDPANPDLNNDESSASESSEDEGSTDAEGSSGDSSDDDAADPGPSTPQVRSAVSPEAHALHAALFTAASTGQLGEVERLLGLGADPNAVHRSGMSVLYSAVTPGNAAVCERLLLAEADVLASLPVCGWTPLHRAGASGATNCAVVLLMFGADPRQPKADGQTPLDLARMNHWDEVVRVLETDQARRNCNSSAEAGGRALHGIKPTLGVPSLRMLTAVTLRKMLGHDRAVLVDYLDLPSQLKRYINHNRPYRPRPPTPPSAEPEPADLNVEECDKKAVEADCGGDCDGSAPPVAHNTGIGWYDAMVGAMKFATIAALVGLVLFRLKPR